MSNKLKKYLYIIPPVIVGLTFAFLAYGQSANYFLLQNNLIKPLNNSWHLQLPYISSGNCIHTIANGQLVGTGSDCGSGGGSSAFLFGSYFIYNATSTDEVNIGSSTANSLSQLFVQGQAGSTTPVFIAASSTGVNILTVQSNGNVGIGTTQPDSILTVSANTTGCPAPLPSSTTVLHFCGANGVSNLRMQFDSFGGSPIITTRRADGTAASPTAVGSDEILFSLNAFGYQGSLGYSAASRASIVARSAEAWTNAANGTYWQFNTTAIGASTTAERMRISDSGNIGIGTTAPITNIGTAGLLLDINGNGTGAGLIEHVNYNKGSEGSITSNNSGMIQEIAGNSTAANNAFIWKTSNSNSSFTTSQVMGLSSAGILTVPTTGPSVGIGESTTIGNTDLGGTNYTELQVNTSNAGTYPIIGFSSNRTDANGQQQGYLTWADQVQSTNFKNLGAIMVATDGTSANQRGGKMNFLVQKNNSAGLQTAMVIDNNANVGIGSSTPSASLVVQGISGNQDILRVATSTGSLFLSIGANGSIGFGTTTPTSTSTYAFVGQYYAGENEIATITANTTIDWAKSNVQHLVASSTSAITLTFANTKPGGRYLLFVQQGYLGSDTITWDSNLQWSAGTAPTLTTTAGKVDIITFVCGMVHCFGGSNLNYAP